MPGSGDLEFSLPAEAVIPDTRCAEIAGELDRAASAPTGGGGFREGGQSASGGAAVKTLLAKQRLFLRHCLRVRACPAFRRETHGEFARIGEGSSAEAWRKLKELCG